MLFLGILAAGAVFAGTNPAYTQFELTHHFKTSCTKFVITEPDIKSAVLAAARNCDIPQSNIWIFDTQDEPIPVGFKSWKKLMDHGQKDWVHFDDEQISKSTTAALLFSSGTTGLPKAAALSHYNLIAQHTLVFEFKRVPYEVCCVLFSPAMNVDIFRPRPPPVVSSNVPCSNSPSLSHLASTIRRCQLHFTAF